MTLEIKAGDAGKRLDLFLQSRLPEYSRSRLQSWIKEGRVKVDDRPAKASYLLRGSELVTVDPGKLPELRAFAEDLPLQILHLDEDVIAIDKPAGMVVHAGAGRQSGTVVNALLHRFRTLSTVGGDERPGIVHRLDRDTSGVLLVARTDRAHRNLAHQFANREVTKVYLALVEGEVRDESGRIETKIARDPVRRTRMTARLGTGRLAISSYKVLERLNRHTLLEVKIATGRTHQIRVHMAHLKHPVAGDSLYGAKRSQLGRFFLHAHMLTFRSPTSGEPIQISSPLPELLKQWLAQLREDKN